MSEWRESREPGWTNDIGYRLQEVLGQHYYDTFNRGSKPDDPGWHACRCGWEGYWCDFHPHLTDDLRRVVVESATRGPAVTDAAVRAALTHVETLGDFPDVLYYPELASAAMRKKIDDRNMAQMRIALEAAQRAQVLFLVPELP